MSEYEHGLSDALSAINVMLDEYLGAGVQTAVLMQAKLRIGALVPVRQATVFGPIEYIKL